MRILIVVLLVLAAACTASEPVATSEPSTTTTSSSATTEPTSTTVAPTTTTTEPVDEETRALLSEIDALVTITEQVRGLEFIEEPMITLVSESELAELVREDLEDELDPEEILPTERLLEALGILEPETGLLDLYLSLYSEQVAGFYDLETSEMVVPVGEGLSPLQRITVVHELTHALTDQHFDFSTTLFALDDADKFEEASALRALVEGDATWTQLVYLQTVMSPEDQTAAIAESQEVDTAILDQTPQFLQDLLLFPYDTASGGAAFVGSLWLDGRSFEAVNDAYLAAPTTTEQIVDADRYRSMETMSFVPAIALAVPGYELVEEGVWGQVALEALFDQLLSQSEASLAANGWGGDRYQIWDDGSNVVFVLRFRGDTPGDLTEMADTLEAFIVAMPTTGTAAVTTEADDVWFIVASDLDVSSLITNATGG